MMVMMIRLLKEVEHPLPYYRDPEGYYMMMTTMMNDDDAERGSADADADADSD